jgi:hypothetical protein
MLHLIRLQKNTRSPLLLTRYEFKDASAKAMLARKQEINDNASLSTI